MNIRLLLINLFIFYAAAAKAGEVTDSEWTIIDDLIVTYSVGQQSKDIEVNCTLFNSSDQAIAGGYSYSAGGVARVRLKPPKKYVGKADLGIRCQP
jgi:hypothetical protein